MKHEIAIVGMACRYPDARSPEQLWQNVLAQRRAFRRMPVERLRLADYPAQSVDGLYSSQAAVLEGYEFDRVAFRVSGRAWRSADLVHWLALDVASEALTDAGFDAAAGSRGLPRDATGVLVGNSLTGEMSRAGLMRLRWPYVRRTVAAALAAEGWSGETLETFLAQLEGHYKAPFPETTEESLAGGLSNTIAGRISNHFDLHGGGYTVDGACASSLLAVANACSALAAGDLEVALAGGVDLSLDPFELVGFARTGALAQGEMRVYDRRSDGFIPGEGCGFLVLMPREKAEAEGRRIYAVIRGWGLSSDGAGGITRPEPEGQLLALERAYRRAGYGIGSVGYFEGHGTGTAVGDAAELTALGRALERDGVGRDGLLPALGSIKANIGHTKAAAGVAGTLKACLALYHEVLPPHTGGRQPHELLESAAVRLRLLERPEAWEAEGSRRASVSAMGFGGINAHLTLESAAPLRRRSLTAVEKALGASPQDGELLLLAAVDRPGLAEQVRQLADLAPRLSLGEVTDLAAYLAQRALEPEGGRARTARAAILAGDPAELSRNLATLSEWLEEETPGPRLDARRGLFLGAREARQPRLGLLFPGQGSPAHRTGGALRTRFESVEAVYATAHLPQTGDGVHTAVAQPAIVTASSAALRLLEELGIEATVAVGHSLGELTALAWAGALDDDALLRLARARGRAMGDLPGETGAMAGLEATPAEAAPLLEGTDAVLAAHNAPRRTVVAGPVATVEALLERAARQGVSARRLPVSHAFHSPLVAPAAPRLAEALAREVLKAQALASEGRRVVSTVTGEELGPETDLRQLLLKQVTSPVRFHEALKRAATLEEIDLWLEVGPGHSLTALAHEGLPGATVVALDAGGPSLRGLLAALGAAFSLGAPVAADRLFAGRLVRPFDPHRELRFLANPCEQAPAADHLAEIVPLRPALPQEDGDSLGLPEQTTEAAENPRLSALELVRQLVARRCELPAEAVREDSRLLSDLHLNSISAALLVTEAARQLGQTPPASPTDYANASVAEVAEALEARGRHGAEAAPRETGSPAGVDTWVRPFVTRLVEQPLATAPRRSDGEAAWRVVAPAEHALAAALRQRLEAAPVAGRGVFLCLPAQLSSRHAALYLEAVRELEAAGGDRFVVVQHGGGGGGFARTLHLERPAVTVCVVDLPEVQVREELDENARRVLAETAEARSYTEVAYGDDGIRRIPVLRPLDLPAMTTTTWPLGPEDVALVTGGGKGIGAECALALARATGARLALVGRSDPATDVELAANLQRLRAAGAELLYLRADVTDRAALAAAVATARQELGPVTGLLHSAGINVPVSIAGLEEAGFQRTLAPKVDGLDAALAALDPARLRLLVTFGSIIGRMGLPGEADYATANEWLSRRTEAFARQHPHCRCLALEWSVWAGVGMGERLGRVEALERGGVSPISTDAGVALLTRLLASPRQAPDVAIAVAGRFGQPPTLELDLPELPFRRFLEQPRVHYPGVELVVEAEISADSDPYLVDHELHGERLFPAVMGLEAMTQTAQAVTGLSALPVLEDVELLRPIVVADGSRETLRLAALVREREAGTGDTVVDVVLRTASTSFQVDLFRARCRFAAGTTEEASPARTLPEPPQPRPLLPLLGDGDLYGGLFFHRGRFRRVGGYRELRATECLAEIAPDGSTLWFGRYQPAELVLGDPGARDAAIHGIQGCIPHATLLPAGVERIELGHLGKSEALLLTARERRRDGDLFVYDLEISGLDGEVKERWHGLRLKAVERRQPPRDWPAPLLGPYVQRRLQELAGEMAGGGDVSVVLLPRSTEASEPRQAASDAALRLALGQEIPGVIHRRPDGRPELVGGGRSLSVAHAGPLVLAVAGSGTVGCDLEPVTARDEQTWRDLLGAERFELAQALAEGRLEGATAEDSAAAATRLWAASEALKKAGAQPGAPLVFARVTDDRWLLLRSGSYTVATLVAPVRELGGPAALAVLVESPAPT